MPWQAARAHEAVAMAFTGLDSPLLSDARALREGRSQTLEKMMGDPGLWRAFKALAVSLMDAAMIV